MLSPPTTTTKAMLTNVAPDGDGGCLLPSSSPKICIVGTGTLGATIAFTLLLKNLCKELILIDEKRQLARGEMLDMQQANMLLNNQRITSSSDYAAASNASLVIIAAGVRRCEMKKEQAARQNSDIFREIVPEIVRHAPRAIFIICSYPADELSYVAWKLSGLNASQVIGVGTVLETARFRAGIAEKLNVHPSCCRGFIIGEPGSNSVPLWSSVNVEGIALKEVNPNIGTPEDPELWMDIHKEMIESGEEIDKQCGAWGMSIVVSKIVNAVLNDTGECLTLSTHVKGCRHGIDKDVFLSLPVIIGLNGVRYILKQCLTPNEKATLQKTADKSFDLIKMLGIVHSE